MNVSTWSVVPEPSGSGTAPCPEPNPTHPPTHLTTHPSAQLFGGLSGSLLQSPGSAGLYRQVLARVDRPDFAAWLGHVRPAAACARPVRLAGTITTYHGTGSGTAADPIRYRQSIMDTASLPDGVIYKACGNRRSAVCPACSKVYQRDAYQIVRAGLVGGKGVPDSVASHPAIFATFTAPGFGMVHHRHVKRHTCTRRARCDCRAEPCHARRDTPACPHGRAQFCFARHEDGDERIGTPLCAECYDYDTHVVWNHFSGELWRRTKQAIDRELAKLCTAKGIDPVTVALTTRGGKPVNKPAAQTSCGKAAEFQHRAVVHFHALIRLDGRDPHDPDAIVAPPASLTVQELDQVILAAARSQAFTTPPHPDAPAGWRIQWGEQIYNVPLVLSGHAEITDLLVAKYARYLAKYATKSTEVTGHTSARITDATIGFYADASGHHTQRLVAACWRIGRPIHTELLTQHYARLLATIDTLAPAISHAQDTGGPAAQAVTLDRLHATIGQLVDVAAAAPKPLQRRVRRHVPTSGAVPGWCCPVCRTISTTMQCQRCAAAQHDRAQRQQRLLLLLLLAGTIPPPADQEDNPYAGLRRWAHMLGFGGHFFTQSKRYSVRFRILRDARVTFRRNETTTITPSTDAADADRAGEQTVLVINSLTLAGIGWHTTADAMLAQTSSELARRHQQPPPHLRDPSAH